MNQDLKAVLPRKGVSSRYVALALKAFERGHPFHTCAKTGTTVQNLEIPAFLRFKIPIAPFDEQLRIVAEIEKQFTRLEAGVAGLRRAQANLKRYRAAVLKAACEGKLVSTEAELAHQEGHAYETGAKLLERVLGERCQKWSGKGKYKDPNVFPRDKFPRLPEGWFYTKLDGLLSPDRVGMKTGPFGTLLKKADQQVQGIPVLGIENIESMKFLRGSKIHITREKWTALTGYVSSRGTYSFRGRERWAKCVSFLRIRRCDHLDEFTAGEPTRFWHAANVFLSFV